MSLVGCCYNGKDELDFQLAKALLDSYQEVRSLHLESVVTVWMVERNGAHLEEMS